MSLRSSSLALVGTGPALPPPSPWVPPVHKLRNVGDMLGRRRALIVVVTAGLTILAVAAAHRITPRFTAQADVMISPRQQQVVDLKAVLAGLGGDSEVVESEIQILRSRELARVVVQRLDLDKLPEFNPALAAPGVTAKLGRIAAEQTAVALDMLPPSVRTLFDRKEPQPEPVVADPLSLPIDAYLRHLGVASKGRSRVISVSFDSADPVLASKAANAAVAAYIEAQLRAKREATDGAHQWLDARVSELRQQVLTDSEAVEAFRRGAGLTQGRGGSLVAEQVTETGEQIIKAQSALAEAEARLNAAAGGRFRAQGLEQSVQIARDRLAQLQTLFGKLRDQSYQGNESEIELRALQHEADADRALYDRLLTRLKETSIESGLQLPDAQVISRAESPVEPAFPKLGVITPIVFVASLLFAGLMALVLESFDRGFSTPDQLEQSLGLSAIGIFPALRRRFRSQLDMSRAQPFSPTAEATRSLQTSLMLSGIERSPKVVLLASALPGEGKSAIALAWARTMAGDGKRVVIVDCDLRRGRIHRACGVLREPGLADLLTGKAQIGEIVQADALSHACVIPTGAGETIAPDLIGAEQMRLLLASLSEQFDLIVLDSAPVLVAAETRGLARLAEKTVMVVRWQATKRLDVTAGVRLLMSAGADVAGCVLSMVSVDRYRRYARHSTYGRHAGLLGQ